MSNLCYFIYLFFGTWKRTYGVESTSEIQCQIMWSAVGGDSTIHADYDLPASIILFWIHSIIALKSATLTATNDKSSRRKGKQPADEVPNSKVRKNQETERNTQLSSTRQSLGRWRWNEHGDRHDLWWDGTNDLRWEGVLSLPLLLRVTCVVGSWVLCPWVTSLELEF